MTRRTAEGTTCEVCQRHLLAGERFRFFDDPARRRYRRPVCALCNRTAIDRGWTLTVELPPPSIPLIEPLLSRLAEQDGADETVQASGDLVAPEGQRGGASPSQ